MSDRVKLGHAALSAVTSDELDRTGISDEHKSERVSKKLKGKNWLITLTGWREAIRLTGK